MLCNTFHSYMLHACQYNNAANQFPLLMNAETTGQILKS